MILIPVMYFLIIVIWAMIPFLGMRSDRYATLLLGIHAAVSAIAVVATYLATRLGVSMVGILGPGAALSIFFLLLKLAFPEKKTRR
ncbi:hypothetical protein AB0J21_06015 [Streptomyces sp. NPDC049954]|uniref:hypothetical protein n=1 Tax=Streptomyces sp. NPDC049954 TaxID=3155779 RepID=UPI003417B032